MFKNISIWSFSATSKKGQPKAEPGFTRRSVGF